MISCKTTTYGRVEFLEESLHSFLLQEFDEENELIIINDYPLQKLIFDHPRVKIFNLEQTFDTIGEKENFAIEKCSGDIIAVWDDDDIAIPNHLSNIKKYWKENTNILHWAKGVYYNEPKITEIQWIGNSGMVYSKNAWERVGKHPIMNAGGDTTFAECIHRLGANNVVFANPPDNEVSWFYRWSMPNLYHQSGMGYDVPGKQDIIQRHSAHIERLRKLGKIPTGEIKLNPHWKKDYKELLNNYVKNKKN